MQAGDSYRAPNLPDLTVTTQDAGAVEVVFDEKSTVVGRFRALIASADWMGRLRWIPRAAWADQRGSLGPIPTEMLESSVCLVTPGGHVTTGYAAIGRLLLASPWFTRRVVLDRWFLRT